ncbi:MAG: hypothetical protein GTO17_01670 [Candidatus Aminicenantes bacterium]|nr:hypothetical protein [Candidatus Aminicenantes bacterium]
MKNSNRHRLAATLILSLLWIASSGYGEEATKTLKGEVYYLEKPDLSLSKRFEWAQKEFESLRKGEYYLAGYSFESRKEVNIHGHCTKLTDSYRVKLREGEIVISRKGETGKHFSTDEGTEQVGILFLHKVSKKTPLIIDADVIDFDNTYEFKETPLFWLGSVNTDESVSYLEDLIKGGNHDLQQKVVFVCSLHNSPKVYDFLKGVALGNYSHKARKNAIFWLGSLKDKKSIDYLKDISKRVEITKLRKQVVFAFQMSDEKEAIEELIRIAKTDMNREVRKNAIFWLGQKASKECVKALKEVLEESEDVELKNNAVFAISQLPDDRAVPMLIDIAKTNKSPSVRKKAIFWLGQTGDKKALKFFEEILLKK